MSTWLIDLLRGLSRDRLGAGQQLACLAESWLAQGAEETAGSNAGPDVSWLIHDGGGDPKSGPPWCAYFVSSLCRQVERAGHRIDHTMTGRAVSHWLKADAAQQIEPAAVWDQDPRGLVFVRTRMSRPVGDREKVLQGHPRQGHTGVVISMDCSDPDARTVTSVAGNSTGWGHSEKGGRGRIALEVMTEGDRAWQRLVGFVRVARP